MAKVEKAISQLHGSERQVMYLYYICGRTWEEVAEAAGYSPVYIYTLRRAIIEKMEL